ncbi:MAG: cell division protein FtsA [Bacteroidales bacterium]|nr:cell division protein FtsA [Bacteroidales bacterium]
MELKEFIVAVDLGTSKIRGIVASKDISGSIIVHASEKEDSNGCIKRGLIQNVDEAASKVKHLISKLEKIAKTKIGKIYIGVGGQSLISINDRIEHQLNDDAQITEEIFDAVKQGCLKKTYPGKEILEVIPSNYIVDGKKIVQPIGVYGSELTIDYTIILGKIAMMKNLKRMIEKLDVEIAGFLLSPLSAEFALSESEKMLGCAFVNMGAGTTTLTIFKDCILKYLVVIPLGGNTVTKDITSLQLLEKDAEQLKIRYGNAFIDSGSNEDIVLKLQNSEGFDSPEVSKSKLSQVCSLRYEEIIENVINQIKLSGLDKQIPSGIIISGGASNISGVVSLWKKKTDLDVKVGSFQRMVTSRSQVDLTKDSSFTTILGLCCMTNNINCYKPEPEPEIAPVSTNDALEKENTTSKDNDESIKKTQGKKSGFSFISKFVGDIFKDDGDEAEFNESNQ